VVANLDVAFVENEAVDAYTDQTLAAPQKMAVGDLDLTDQVDAIVALQPGWSVPGHRSRTFDPG
jgi:hypothetical protein